MSFINCVFRRALTYPVWGNKVFFIYLFIHSKTKKLEHLAQFIVNAASTAFGAKAIRLTAPVNNAPNIRKNFFIKIHLVGHNKSLYRHYLGSIRNNY